MNAVIGLLKHPVPEKAQSVILEEAIQRDLTTARRAVLLSILWQERYLNRQALISRVEMRLGWNCFGESSWEDTFYRDMRVVKAAFKAAGDQLAYSRKKERSGYYLKGKASFHDNLVTAIHGSIKELDRKQLAIYQKLTHQERFRQGCSISNTARKIIKYRKKNNE